MAAAHVAAQVATAQTAAENTAPPRETAGTESVEKEATDVSAGPAASQDSQMDIRDTADDTSDTRPAVQKRKQPPTSKRTQLLKKGRKAQKENSEVQFHLRHLHSACMRFCLQALEHVPMST
jgi:hypothetical protein